VLDVGCGPGHMVRELLNRRAGDFRITALDRSAAMVDECLRHTGRSAGVRGLVGRVESLPFADASFDAVLALGLLEYTRVSAALAEIARVVRPGGLVVTSMLNPASPYRFVQFHVYWPLLRALRATEAVLGVPADRRHGRVETGIRAYSEHVFRDLLAEAGLRAMDTAHFDATVLVPPIDRIVRRLASGQQERPEKPVSGRWRARLATAYLVTAARLDQPPGQR
jgi:ubiquinone/menaquinone biosynthesis C-methylase UbiE